MNDRSLHWLLVLPFFGAVGACPGGGDDTDPTPPDPATPLTAFSDIDGIVVRRTFGPSAALYAMNPRTGEHSAPFAAPEPYLDERTIAPSPDGLHFAFFAGESRVDLRVVIARLGMQGSTPAITPVREVALPGRFTSSDADLWYDTSATWVFGWGFAIDVATGTLLSCEGEPAAHVAPLPDGRHLLLACPNGERLYRDGELVWRGAITGKQPHLEQTRATAGPDGDWLDTRFHVPTRTIFRPASPAPLVTEGLTDFGYDLEGRRVYAPAGIHGRVCDTTVSAPSSQGARHDLQGMATGTSTIPTKPLELGSSGAFFELPADNLGMFVGPWGFDGDGSHFVHRGLVTEMIIDTSGIGPYCREEPRQLRVRRVPVDGGAPTDTFIDLLLGIDCSPIRHERFDAWSPATAAIAGPGDRMVCLGRGENGVVFGAGSPRLLEQVGPLASPGRRMTLSQRRPENALSTVMRLCRQRIDDPAKARCDDDPIGEAADLFWGGWAVPGAGGLAGPAVYRLSHRGATPGTTVTVFGAGFGASIGELRLGDYRVPASAIVDWGESRVRFTMPADAPTDPAAVVVNGGADVATRMLYRATPWTPNLQVPERIEARYGSVFIPVTGMGAETAQLAFFMPGDEGVGGLVQLTTRAVSGGVELDVRENVPPGEYWLTVTLGPETRTVRFVVTGEQEPVTTQWTKLVPELSSIDYRLRDAMLEAGGGVILRATLAPRVRFADGSTATVRNPENLFAGVIAVGPFDPYFVRADGQVQELTGWQRDGDEATAVWTPHAPLPAEVVAAIGRTDYDWNVAVGASAQRALVFTVKTSSDCATTLCSDDWVVDLASGSAVAMPRTDRLTGITGTATTSAGLHAFEGNTLRTFSAAGVDFGVERADERVETPPAAVARATSWGFIAHDRSLHRAHIASRADASKGFSDLGLADVVAIGTARDGSIAVIATATGEVFYLDATSPTTPIALGAPAGWAHSLAALGQTWITVTAAGHVLWLVQSGPAELYLRALR